MINANELLVMINKLALERDKPALTLSKVKTALSAKDEPLLNQSWRERIKVEIWDGISDVNTASAAHIRQTNTFADVIYLLRIDGEVVFLQAHKPSEQGWIPISAENVDEISNNHANDIAAHYAENQIIRELLQEFGIFDD